MRGEALGNPRDDGELVNFTGGEPWVTAEAAMPANGRRSARVNRMQAWWRGARAGRRPPGTGVRWEARGSMGMNRVKRAGPVEIYFFSLHGLGWACWWACHCSRQNSCVRSENEGNWMLNFRLSFRISSPFSYFPPERWKVQRQFVTI